MSKKSKDVEENRQRNTSEKRNRRKRREMNEEGEVEERAGLASSHDDRVHEEDIVLAAVEEEKDSDKDVGDNHPKSKKPRTALTATVPTAMDACMSVDSSSTWKPPVRDSVSVSSIAFSPFRMITLRLEVSLPPLAAVGDIKGHVRRNVLSPLLLQYDRSVGGLLLGYDNLRYEDSKERGGGGGISMRRVRNEAPHFHFSVSVDGLALCPRVGMTLDGVVHEVSPSNVDILLYSFLNVIVMDYELAKSGFMYDQTARRWISCLSGNMENCRDGAPSSATVGGNEKKAPVIKIGTRVRFDVAKISECAGLLSIEGSNPLVPL